MLKWNGGGNSPTLKTMKKYIILNDCIVQGKKHHSGDIVELDEKIGNELIGYHKAEVHVAKESTKKTDRSVGLESSEEKKIVKRSKK
jgi:hypothetical protein